MEKREDLLTERIPKLIFEQALPATLGLLVISVYSIVDSIFIGRQVGTLGLAGIAVSFPFYMLIGAVAQSVGIGVASIVSRSLGGKKVEKSEKALGNFFSLVILLGISITFVALIFLTPMLEVFGATPNILPYALDYTQIMVLGAVFLTLAFGSNAVIRSEGSAKFAMMVMVTGAGVNILLDPIFISVLGMGMRGAAIATVIAQILSMFLALYYFLRRGKVDLKLKNLGIDKKITKEVFSIGASSFFRLSAGVLSIIVLNNFLGIYGGDVAIAAYGVINRVLMLFLIPVFGLVAGLQPVLGFNYGAKKYKRAKQSISFSVKTATLLASVGFLITLLFPEQIISVFSKDPNLISLAKGAARIIVLALPLAGVTIVGGGIYQAMGKPFLAFIVSILRRILLLIPLVSILPLFFNLKGIWWGFPITDILAGAITGLIIYKEIKLLNGDGAGKIFNKIRG